MLLRNILLLIEVEAFRLGRKPDNPAPFIVAVVRCMEANGLEWIKTDEARGLLHALNQMAHGQGYEIHAAAEEARFKALFADFEGFSIDHYPGAPPENKG